MRSSELDAADRALLDAAATYRARAYAPYSRYQVGAALRGADGAVYGGCNVEHIVFSLSCCAERVGIFAAIAQGTTSFDTCAVMTDSSPPAAPCGPCRQMLRDFGVDRVILGNTSGEVVVTTMAELLPMAFVLER